MGKIDYSKAEREMHDALQRMRVQQLAEGKSVTSQRAADFFGLSQKTPRPTPEEPVERMVREEAARHEGEEKQRKEEEASQKLAEKLGEKAPTPNTPPSDEPLEEGSEAVRRTPMYDDLKKAKAQSARPPRSVTPLPTDVPPSDTFRERVPPLYLLRQHILWLKRHHKENRYELLGTTRAEIMEFRAARRLTEAQLSRIKEINLRADEIKAGILAEEGMKTDEGEVETQKKKSKTKRFNIKDTWFPL